MDQPSEVKAMANWLSKLKSRVKAGARGRPGRQHGEIVDGVLAGRDAAGEVAGLAALADESTRDETLRHRASFGEGESEAKCSPAGP